jgi:hypothetical protein
MTLYQALFNQTNKEMHSVLGNGLRAHRNLNAKWLSAAPPKMDNDREKSPDESIKGDTREIGPGPLTPEERPVDNSPRWRDVDSLPLIDPQSNQKLKQSYKETDHSFEIFLSYQGVESPRVVNENLPNKILYWMARSYLQDEFGFRLSSDLDLNSEFEGRLLSRLGVLEDSPIVTGSVINVIYPTKPPVSGESPTVPSAKFGPSYEENRSRALGDRRPSTPGEVGLGISSNAQQLKHQSQSFQSQHHPGLSSPRVHFSIRATSNQSGPIPMQDRQSNRVHVDGDELYDEVVINSLDPRSYDKIRQNFKCPKFTGQARDWKIWDKGFWRYLSIWELEYEGIGPSL